MAHMTGSRGAMEAEHLVAQKATIVGGSRIHERLPTISLALGADIQGIICNAIVEARRAPTGMEKAAPLGLPTPAYTNVVRNI